MKQLWACLLFLAFVVNITGVFFVFKVQRFQIRREAKQLIKQGIPDDEIYHIKVTPDNAALLKWINKHEFSYQGIMYDVVRKVVRDKSTVVYHCVTDMQETILFGNYLDMLCKAMSPWKRGNTLVLNFFKFLSHLTTPPQHALPVSEILIRPLEWIFQVTYNSPVRLIPHPPPKYGV